MPRVVNAAARHPGRSAAALLAGVAGVAVLALAGIAVAKSFTLRVTKNVHVTNVPTAKFAVKSVNMHEAVAVGPSGYAVYTFQGETTHHIICQKAAGCWAAWPPVSPSGSGAVTKASGISGKLGTFKNHGVTQLTLNRQPLYYFAPDIMAGNKHQALGDELKTFGSIWHVVKASGSSATSNAGSSSTSSNSSTTSTNPYPPGTWG
jgi:predicted lipoprotein with Yx(FWY)xxD motif